MSEKTTSEKLLVETKKFFSYFWVQFAILLIIVLFIFSGLYNKYNAEIEPAVYVNQIEQNFIEEINKPAIGADQEYNGFFFHYAEKSKKYHKTENGFSYYNDNTIMNVIFFPEYLDFQTIQNEYLGSLGIKGNLVINDQYDNNGEFSCLQVYELEDGTYTVIVGEDNVIINFDSTYENLAKNIDEATKLVNSVSQKAN